MPVRRPYRTADIDADGAIRFGDDAEDRGPPLLPALDRPFRPAFPRVPPRSPDREDAGEPRMAPEGAG